MPDLFLSYNRDDSLAMGIIRDNLRKLGFNVWIDIEYLEPGTPQWKCAVEDAARKTDMMLVLCSPAAKQSKWVNIEITIAELARKTIIPIWVNGDDPLEAIPTSLLSGQRVDMRGRHPERGFSELVAWLARHFALDIPDYQFETSIGEIPVVQVINVTGHVEGDVITIGRDVEGDMNVAGGDIQQITSRKASPWAWIGGIGAALVIIGIIGLIAVLRGGSGTEPPASEEPVKTEVMVAVAETSEVTAAPTPFPTDEPARTPPTQTNQPTVEPTRSAFDLAERGVSNNREWEPYFQEFDGVKMALVPAGCFMMGSESGKGDEQPLHHICFNEPFWIDVYEVTNRQYGSASEDCLTWSSSDDQPRICTGWSDVVIHCESRGARLPTEAEWEYSARGPDGLVYPWRNEFIADNVVYDGNNPGGTASVGSKPGGVSWVGAYDLSGNVWEWVSDWYDSDYYDSSPVDNPQGPDNGTYRVLRGGSWLNSNDNVNATGRYWFNPTDWSYAFGFRCARSYQP
jgi:sulfatase modifying factor 1